MLGIFFPHMCSMPTTFFKIACVIFVLYLAYSFCGLVSRQLLSVNVLLEEPVLNLPAAGWRNKASPVTLNQRDCKL
jgi:hypothetical protein